MDFASIDVEFHEACPHPFAPSPTGYLHIGGARTALLLGRLRRRHGLPTLYPAHRGYRCRPLCCTGGEYEPFLDGIRRLNSGTTRPVLPDTAHGILGSFSRCWQAMPPIATSQDSSLRARWKQIQASTLDSWHLEDGRQALLASVTQSSVAFKNPRNPNKLLDTDQELHGHNVTG